MAGILFPHMTNDWARDIEKSEDICIELCAGFGIGDFFDSADESVACVVDKDINFAEGLDGFFYGKIDLGLVRDIEGGGYDLIGELVFEVGKGFWFAGGGDDVLPLCEEFFGKDSSESGGCSGNEPGFCGHDLNSHTKRN